MKITFIIDSLQHGGAERVVSNLAEGFSEHGHDTSILILSDFGDCSFYKIHKDVKVMSLMKSKGEKISKISKILRLRKIMKEYKETIFIAFLPHICIYTYFASLFLKNHYFLSERSDPNQYNFLYKVLLKIAFKKASGCIFQSKLSKQFYFKKERHNARIIFNPVVFKNVYKNTQKRDNKLSQVYYLFLLYSYFYNYLALIPC